jgi:hypothetical protein
VSDLSEGVVLLEDRDRRSGAPALRIAAIRRLDVLVAALDRESGALEELGDPKSASRRSSIAFIARCAIAFGSLNATGAPR